MKSEQGYQPSPEEVKKAEEMTTDEKRDATLIREQQEGATKLLRFFLSGKEVLEKPIEVGYHLFDEPERDENGNISGVRTELKWQLNPDGTAEMLKNGEVIKSWGVNEWDVERLSGYTGSYLDYEIGTIQAFFKTHPAYYSGYEIVGRFPNILTKEEFIKMRDENCGSFRFKKNGVWGYIRPDSANVVLQGLNDFGNFEEVEIKIHNSDRVGAWVKDKKGNLLLEEASKIYPTFAP